MGNSISRIGQHAFERCLSLASVSLSDTIEIIDDYAFAYCNLISISLSNRLVKIGNHSFDNCSKLSSISLPSTLKYIGDSAFAWCGGLKTISIPENVETVGCEAFNLGWSCLKELYIKSTTISINHSAFDDFEHTHSIEIISVPAGYKKIFEEMLPDYKDVIVEQEGSNVYTTEVTYDDIENAWTDEYGVKYSADKKRLLKASNDLKEYNIRKGTKVICNKAFLACSELRSIIIPDSVKSIGESAFLNCNSLHNITIPQDVTEISDKLLCSCFSLKEISILGSITRIGVDAFRSTGIKSINIPQSVTSIEDGAFYFCESLESITIPENVKYIGVNPIAGSGVNKIVCKSRCFETDGVALYNIGKEHLIGLCSGAKNYVIPDSVISIGEHAFYNCSNMETISIPSSVERAGKEVFFGSAFMKSVIIPKGTKEYFEKLLPQCKYKLVEEK